MFCRNKASKNPTNTCNVTPKNPCTALQEKNGLPLPDTIKPVCAVVKDTGPISIALPLLPPFHWSVTFK